jgi:hypothetical protein
VPNDVYLVFSRPPAGVSAEEYDRWYRKHVRENVETPGFVSGTRFAVQPVRGAAPAHTHLALYEYRGDIMDLRAQLQRRIEAGGIVLPEWFPQIEFATFDCKSIDDQASAAPPRRRAAGEGAPPDPAS